MMQKATTYQGLQTDLAQLYKEYNVLSSLKRQLGTEYTQAKSTLGQLDIKHQFPQIEAELNVLIANSSSYNTPTALISEIEAHLVYLRAIDQGIDVLQGKYQQHKQVPSRKGWADTVSKLKAFLDKLPSLPLKLLQQTAQVHLPKAHQAIADMEAAIEAEQTCWSRIEREAREFKTLLDSHRQTVDCHGFAAAYEPALHFVNRLIQSPNMMQLALEEQEFLQHKNAVDECLQLFDEERKAIDDYKPYCGWGKLWCEDAIDIRNMAITAEGSIYTSPIRLGQIVDAASEAIKRKHRDIEAALASFKPETRETFSAEIKELQDKVISSTALPVLVKRMKQYEAEQQKAFLLKIAKWVAWILGGLLLLGGLYWLFSSYGTYIVIGLIIIGIAVKVFES